MHPDEERDEAEIQALFRLVDHPAPNVTAESVAARAGGRRGFRARWAAGLLLALAAAGAAYAVPGSPLREWVRSAVEWRGDGEDTAEPAPQLAGIAVQPGDSLTIVFTSVQPEGRVRVSVGPWTELRVRAPTGAARFTSDAARLVIDNTGPAATFEIEIPRDAPLVRIEVAGTRIFLKEGPRVSGEGKLPLAPGRSSR